MGLPQPPLSVSSIAPHLTYHTQLLRSATSPARRTAICRSVRPILQSQTLGPGSGSRSRLACLQGMNVTHTHTRSRSTTWAAPAASVALSVARCCRLACDATNRSTTNRALYRRSLSTADRSSLTLSLFTSLTRPSVATVAPLSLARALARVRTGARVRLLHALPLPPLALA